MLPRKLDICVYSYTHRNGKIRISIFGIQVYKRVRFPDFYAYYLCGLKIFTKKIKQLKTNENSNINKYENINCYNKNYNKNKILNIERLNIAFKCTGGVGDILIATNYIYAIYKKMNINNVNIDIYTGNNIDMTRSILEKSNFINGIYTLNDIEDDCKSYDLFVEIQRYPFIRYNNLQKIDKFSPFLVDLIYEWQKFRMKNSRYWRSAPRFDGQSNHYAILLKQKRISQPDVFGYLGIDEKFLFKPHLPDYADDYINSLGLLNKKFITIHRGVDARQYKNSTKLWPKEYYDILIPMLKEKYTNIPVIQLGISKDGCPRMDGVDIYLAGKTTFEQVKTLLSYSTLHIDGEGGFVHLRHALSGGKSVVLFGPTSMDFYGYSENINLRGNACPECCEWITPNWQEQCSAGFGKNLCMYSLSPNMVFNTISNNVEI